MSTKNLLSNDERLELIDKYEKDKLNSPPGNILDSTLIKNYGSDEQKQRLQPASTKQEQEGVQTESSGGEQEQTETDKPDNGGEQLKEDSQLDESLKAQESENPIQTTSLGDNTGNIHSYVEEFGRYMELFNTRPDQSLTVEDLKAANDQKETDLKREAAQAAEIKANLKSQATASATATNITLVNSKNGEQIVVSQLTYEEYIKKSQPEWSPVVEVPEEARHLKK